jgi:hypothetical protein
MRKILPRRPPRLGGEISEASSLHGISDYFDTLEIHLATFAAVSSRT